jgi:hypothetical protein
MAITSSKEGTDFCAAFDTGCCWVDAEPEIKWADVSPQAASIDWIESTFDSLGISSKQDDGWVEIWCDVGHSRDPCALRVSSGARDLLEICDDAFSSMVANPFESKFCGPFSSSFGEAALKVAYRVGEATVGEGR